MSIVHVASRNGSRATIGRYFWSWLHEYAQEVEPENVDIFTSKVSFALKTYECEICRKNLNKNCSILLEQLQYLKTKQDCIVWAARLHACVTLHILQDPEAYVSSESARLAQTVNSMSDAEVLREVVT